MTASPGKIHKTNIITNYNMSFAHNTIQAQQAFFLTKYTERHVSTRLTVADVQAFKWPPSDPSSSGEYMSEEEATTFLIMIKDDIQDREDKARLAADRAHERDMAMAVAQQKQAEAALRRDDNETPQAQKFLAEPDKTETAKLDTALAIWDSTQAKGKVGCADDKVRHFLCRDVRHEYNKFSEFRKRSFDALSNEEQALLMNEPFDVSALPPAAQSWLRTAYAAKCHHLIFLYIQAEIFSATKHICSIASIKESVELRKPRFVREGKPENRPTKRPHNASN